MAYLPPQHCYADGHDQTAFSYALSDFAYSRLLACERGNGAHGTSVRYRALRSIIDGIAISETAGKLVFLILAAVAEIERALDLERTPTICATISKCRRAG